MYLLLKEIIELWVQGLCFCMFVGRESWREELNEKHPDTRLCFYFEYVQPQTLEFDQKGYIYSYVIYTNNMICSYNSSDSVPASELAVSIQTKCVTQCNIISLRLCHGPPEASSFEIFTTQGEMFWISRPPLLHKHTAAIQPDSRGLRWKLALY